MGTIVFYIKHLSMLRTWVDPIAPFMAEQGYRIVILHASSLNGDTSQAAPPTSCPYETIEIGGKRMRDIVSTLRALEPCAILMFTFRSLFDLLLIRVARHYKFKTIYVQHGFYISTKFQMASKRVSFYRYYHFARWYLSFLSREKRRTIPQEISAIYRTMFRVDYRTTGFDHGVFYSRAGLKDANQYFAFGEDQAHFSGYPIVSEADELTAMAKARTKAARRRVLYIHQPFVIDKFTHLTHEEEFAFLRRIGDICDTNGFELLVKIHPRESLERYKEALADSAVIIDESGGILSTLQDCAVAIGHFSTALFTGVLLGKPIILLDYPGLADKYYSLFERVGIRARSLDELKVLLANEALYENRLSEFKTFIDEFVGHNNTYEHQAETIVNIIDSPRSTSHALGA